MNFIDDYKKSEALKLRLLYIIVSMLFFIILKPIIK